MPLESRRFVQGSKNRIILERGYLKATKAVVVKVWRLVSTDW
ncbi:hypothetical protein [Nostoc foliaceum]|nr:hypothetical protein [Nostoc foliaceum]